MKYLASIGLEVHVQLKTQSKMFCACPVVFGAAPNAHTCPICLGLPGALPVINRGAVSLTLLTGLMLDCDIAESSKFDRKNYFYTDMPKNYQISQYDMPLCTDGAVTLSELAYPTDARKAIAAPDKTVHLVRIHLEEDVARSFHLETSTGIDFNRAGTPLMEIVTRPEMETPEEAFAFLSALKQILISADVSDADMEKGQLRCDCNVSVRAEKEAELGIKVEIKNMNSISGVRRALAFEIQRQSAVLARGETVRQETRGWDDMRGETFLMRTKETAHDYRYFPDPDLPLLKLDTLLPEVRARLPELPAEKRKRLVREYGVTPYDAASLAHDRDMCRYFEAAARDAKNAKAIANWTLNDLRSALVAAGKRESNSPVVPEALCELVGLIDSGKISGKQAKEVFAEMFASGKSPAAIVRASGLEQLIDEGAIAALADEVIAANVKPAADFRAGNAAALNFLKGQVMKLSGGKANPRLAGEILRQKLNS